MDKDLLRSLARAIGGRVKSALKQVAKDEAARAVRYFRERLQRPAPASRDVPAETQPALTTAPAPPPEPLSIAATPGPAPEPTRTEPAGGGPAGRASSASMPQRAAAKAARPSPSKTSARTTDATPSSGEAVNVNAASKDELIALPGIGEARADAIIKARPFKSTAELVERKVLPANVYRNLKGKIGVA